MLFLKEIVFLEKLKYFYVYLHILVDSEYSHPKSIVISSFRKKEMTEKFSD